MRVKNEVVWGRRDLREVNHWKAINLKDYSPNKPVVVCVGGNGTISENSANGMCKFVENHLHLLFNKNGKNQIYDYIDIISAVYPVADNDSKGEFSKEDIDNFVDNFLIKIIQDESDELVPLNEACRRLSQITFFTFCRGHLEVDKIMRAFYKELKVLGYSRQQCDVLMMSFFEISYAPLTYNAITPIMFVDSKQDEMINNAWKNDETSIHLDEGLNGVTIKLERYGEPLLSGIAVSEAIFDAIHVYSSRLRNNVEIDEHNLSILSRGEDWNSEYESNADCVSQIIAWAISRSVENGIDNNKSKKFKPKMIFEELISELESIKKGFSEEELMSKE